VGFTKGAFSKKSQIRTYYRNGKPFNVASSAEFSFSQIGVDIELIDLMYVTGGNGDSEELIVLLKVNGALGLTAYGDDDIAIAVLDVDQSNGLQLRDIFQFGTEEADKPIRLVADAGGGIYILAESAGQTIENRLPEFANKGGKDALIYRLNAQYNKDWARFVGTSQDDTAVDINFISGEIHVLTQSRSSGNGSQAQIYFLDTDDRGAEIDSRRSLSLEFLDQQVVTATFSGDNGNKLLFSSYGEQNPLDGSFSATGTDDAYIVEFTFRDENIQLTSFLDIDSTGNDRITKSGVLDDDERFMLAGVTDGRLDGNNAFGGQDAFVWGIDLTESTSDAPFQVQFGTPGTDTIIDVAPVLDGKFMVLWSEDYTAGDNSLRYRVSAFAPDGRKLSPSL
jgi:hypothetical protein